MSCTVLNLNSPSWQATSSLRCRRTSPSRRSSLIGELLRLAKSPFARHSHLYITSWIPFIMISWSIVMVCMGLVRSGAGLIAARFFLGVVSIFSHLH